MKTLSKTKILVAAVVLATVAQLTAGDTPGANPFFGVLSTATLAELPARSADLVVQADSKTCLETTINVVKAAVGLNPAAAPAIVGSIAQQKPEAAAVAAGTAAALVPNQAVAIARAAAAAAPSEAGKIVEAVCHAVPGAYQAVANAVAEVAPGAGKDILSGVSAGVPALKDAINKVLLSYKGNVTVGEPGARSGCRDTSVNKCCLFSHANGSVDTHRTALRPAFANARQC